MRSSRSCFVTNLCVASLWWLVAAALLVAAVLIVILYEAWG